MTGFGDETAVETGSRQLASRPVVVTTHAVDQAIARGHYEGTPVAHIRAFIRQDVRSAYSENRVSRTKPLWATLYAEQPVGKPCSPLRAGQEFVWNADTTLGWIVAAERGALVVVTSLHRVRGEQAA